MENYWTYNSLILLIGLTIFPRFSLLFCIVPGTILFWIGWIVLPRLTIAILATFYYASTNPILVILSWIIAMGGESLEKSYGYKVRKNKSFTKTRNVEYEIIDDDK